MAAFAPYVEINLTRFLTPSTYKTLVAVSRCRQSFTLAYVAIPGSLSTPNRFDLDEHRAGMRLCINTT